MGVPRTSPTIKASRLYRDAGLFHYIFSHNSSSSVILPVSWYSRSRRMACKSRLYSSRRTRIYFRRLIILSSNIRSGIPESSLISLGVSPRRPAFSHPNSCFLVRPSKLQTLPIFNVKHFLSHSLPS